MLVVDPPEELEPLDYALVHTLAATLDIKTPKQFITWTATALQSIFPHGAMVAALVRVDRAGACVHKLLSRNFPAEVLELAVSPTGDVRCSAFSRWIRDNKPQLLDAQQAAGGCRSDLIRAIQQSDLENIAAHGLRDFNGSMVSYFSFSRIPEPLGADHAQLLQMIVPHMHLAFVRSVAKARRFTTPMRAASALISIREKEVLEWLRFGKTNGEIAQILGVSHHTVKNTVSTILAKLGVSNRTRAVAKAGQAGLV